MAQSTETSNAKNVNYLTLKIQKTLKEGDKNVFYSPVSISLALSMLVEGADGETRDEICSLLGLSSSDSEMKNLRSFIGKIISNRLAENENCQVRVANMILVAHDKKIRENFASIMNTVHRVTVESVDFRGKNDETVKKINEFVQNSTNNLIPKLVNTISPSTIMCLINAIVFEGKWQKKFSANKTFRSTFKSEKPTEILFMNTNLHTKLYDNSDRDFRVSRLPYLGPVAMYVFLPRENLGLKSLLDSLDEIEMEKIITDLRSLQQQEIRVRLPKFEFESQYGLTNILPKLGMKRAFDPERAQFSNMIENDTLFVNEAIHKAVIKVDEEGTRAAAVTAIMMLKSCRSVMVDPPEFFVDHPFMFILRDEEIDINLFFGIVKNL